MACPVQLVRMWSFTQTTSRRDGVESGLEHLYQDGQTRQGSHSHKEAPLVLSVSAVETASLVDNVIIHDERCCMTGVGSVRSSFGFAHIL